MTEDELVGVALAGSTVADAAQNLVRATSWVPDSAPRLVVVGIEEFGAALEGLARALGVPVSHAATVAGLRGAFERLAAAVPGIVAAGWLESTEGCLLRAQRWSVEHGDPDDWQQRSERLARSIDRLGPCSVDEYATAVARDMHQFAQSLGLRVRAGRAGLAGVGRGLRRWPAADAVVCALPAPSSSLIAGAVIGLQARVGARA